MEFGKLNNVDKVDFTLPKIDPYTKKILGGKPAQNFKIHFGLPIWGVKEWKGKIYPKDAQPKDFLKYYAQKLKTIELNTTHYRIPDEATIAKWIAETPEDFTFNPKFPQTISHATNYENAKDEARLFCDAIRPLEKRLGMAFIQLPPGVGRLELPNLAKLITTLPPDIEYAAEFRHKNLFKDGILLTSLAEFLTKHKISTVITDVAGRRDVSHTTLTTKKMMVRFIGNNLHPTDFTRIDAWAERIEELKAMGLEELYFFCHENNNEVAPEVAVYTAGKLGVEFTAPVAVSSDQMALF